MENNKSVDLGLDINKILLRVTHDEDTSFKEQNEHFLDEYQNFKSENEIEVKDEFMEILEHDLFIEDENEENMINVGELDENVQPSTKIVGNIEVEPYIEIKEENRSFDPLEFDVKEVEMASTNFEENLEKVKNFLTWKCQIMRNFSVLNHFLNSESHPSSSTTKRTKYSYRLDPPEKRLRCSECSFIGNNEGSLKTHMVNHKGIKLLKCPQCDYGVILESDLKVHMLTHIKSDKNIEPYKCTECNFECHEKIQLKKHLLMVHSGKKLLSCPQCDYKCVRSDHMRTHLLDHQGLKLFRCAECGFECNKKHNMKNHMLTHSDKKLFQCPHCSYECNKKTGLKSHMLSHSTTKLLKCPECSYETNHHHLYKFHVLDHKGIKLFKCPQCDYECNRKDHLKRHSLKHLKMFKKDMDD